MYTDPHILQGKLPSEKSDIYSFGITCWQLLSREIPYEGYTLHTIIYKVSVVTTCYGSHLYPWRDRLLSIEVHTLLSHSYHLQLGSQDFFNSLKLTVASRGRSSSAALVFLLPVLVSNLTPVSFYFLVSLYPYCRAKL